MSDMNLEYFPPREPLGSPGDGASPIKLAAGVLAALAALAAAAAALFYFYVETVPVYIDTTTAQVDVLLRNREPDQEIFWTLVEGSPPLTPPEPPYTQLEQDQQRLQLDRLEPGTEYTLVFLEYGEDGQPVIVHTFTFTTDGFGRPPAPPETPPQEQQELPPPEEEAPPQEETPPQEQMPPEEDTQTEGTPSLTPPYTPPAGGDSGDDAPSKTAGGLYFSEGDSRNTITAQLPNNEEIIEVVISILDYTPGDYEFKVTQLNLRADGQSLTEVDDYFLQEITVGDQEITITLKLKVNEAWRSKNYTYLDVEVVGGSYENGTLVGSASSTQVSGQVNLVQGYSVAALTSPLSMEPFNGMFCESVGLATEISNGDFLTDVVPGQTVEISLYFSGSAEAPLTLAADYDVSDGLGFVPIQGSYEITGAGKDFAWLSYSFTMPQRDVTDADIQFRGLYEVPSGSSYALQSVSSAILQSTAPAAPEADSAGPHSVGPLTISDSIHGLTPTEITFTSGDQSGVQLQGVEPGQTVYVNLLLRGVSLKSFGLSAAFASSLPDLQVIMTDQVAIGDSDAYLRLSFTMPARAVTGADIGFLGFTTQ